MTKKKQTDDDEENQIPAPRERRPTISEYVRNNLWWIEWTPWFNFRKGTQTFYDYYHMSRRQAPTSNETLPEESTKEETYGALIDYVFNIFSAVPAEPKKKMLLVVEDSEIEESDFVKTGIRLVFHFTPKKYFFYSLFFSFMFITWSLFIFFFFYQVIVREDAFVKIHNLLRYDYSLQTNATNMMHMMFSKELQMRAEEQMTCENDSLTIREERGDLIFIETSTMSRQGAYNIIHRWFELDIVQVKLASVSKIGCAERKCKNAVGFMCKYYFLPPAVLKYEQYSKENETRDFITEDDMKAILVDQGEHLSRCQNIRHPDSGLCINYCEFHDLSLFCETYSKKQCNNKNILSQCLGHCKCDSQTISFQPKYPDDYIRAFNDFRDYYLPGKLGKLRLNSNLETSAHNTLYACMNYETEWHFTSPKLTSFLDQRMVWMTKYPPEAATNITRNYGQEDREFLNKMISNSIRSVGCSHAFCTGEFIYLCYFD